MGLDDALIAADPEAAATILRATAGGVIAVFEEALPTALQGGFASVVVVTRNWDSLVDQALRSASSVVPGSLETTEAAVILAQGQRIDWLPNYLRAAVADAPFSRFVGAFGPGVGMAIACLAKVREAVDELVVLPSPRAPLPQFHQAVDVLRFHRLVELAIRGMSPPLEHLQESLGLSTAELGGIFGVTRQAIDQWRVRGIPPERRAKMADLLAVVDLLERKLKPGRLPLVVRRAASAFDGRSMLELAATDEHAGLREKVERAFDWASAA